MTVLTPGVAPVDLSDRVRKPDFVVTFPAPESEFRAEVHGNGSRAMAERAARDIYRAALEAGRLLDARPRGVIVLHLVALPSLPKSYRFSVAYAEGDAGMNYLFETAYFYAEGDDPMTNPDSPGLRHQIFHVLPHELSHRLCTPNLAYHVRPDHAEAAPIHAPRWLDDGIAEFVGCRVMATLASDLPPVVWQEDGRKVLHALGASFLEWPDSGHSDSEWRGFPAEDHYAAAHLLVETLLDGDEQKLRDFLRWMLQAGLRDHTDLREMIRRRLQVDLEALIARF
jgi:hypothetical protein